MSATVGHAVDDWAQHSAFYITNSRGQRLFVQLWRPLPPSDTSHPNPLVRLFFPGRHRRVTRERAIVHVLHGLNDHSNKYADVAREWVRAGYIVAAHDSHGHGRSDGLRAHTSSMQHYVDDARYAMDEAVGKLPRRLGNLPRIILAHSLGGAVAIHVAREKPPPKLRGVILTAPAVRVFPKPLLRIFAPVIATLAPFMPVQRLKFDRARRRRLGGGNIGSGNRGGGRSTSGGCVDVDPLVVRKPVRARVGYEVLKSCEKIMSSAEQFRVPVFLAHSANDRVTNAKGTIEFLRRIGSADKTVRLYDGGVHDLLSNGGGEVLDDMIEWAGQRLR